MEKKKQTFEEYKIKLYKAKIKAMIAAYKRITDYNPKIRSTLDNKWVFKKLT